MSELDKAKEVIRDILFELHGMPCSASDFLGKELYADAHELAYGYRPEYEDEDDEEGLCGGCAKNEAAEPHDCPSNPDSQFGPCDCCDECVKTLCLK